MREEECSLERLSMEKLSQLSPSVPWIVLGSPASISKHETENLFSKGIK